MPQTAPAGVVNALPAAPPKFSLLASSPDPNDDAATRWQGGFGWLPEAQAAHGVRDQSDITNNFGASTQIAKRTEVPFVIWAADSASELGTQRGAEASRDWEGRALRQLEAATPFELEREFWEGAVSTANSLSNKFLTDANVTDIHPAGALAPAAALGCLEQALGGNGYGGQGMIHATRSLVTQWAALYLVRPVGRLLLTAMDTIVVPGVGYRGLGPSNAAPASGEIWAYATDLVVSRIGAPLTIPGGAPSIQALDRTVNTATYRAERLAATQFDGGRQFAIRAQVPTC